MTADREFLARHAPHFAFFVFLLASTVGIFTGGIWATFGIVGALILFFAVWRIEGQPPLPERPWLFLVSGALAIMALLNFHSSLPARSWPGLEKLATIFVPLSLFFNPGIQKRAASAEMIRILPFVALFGIMCLSAELFFGTPLLKLVRGPEAQPFQYNRGFSYFVLLAFPLMAFLRESKYRWLILPFVVLLFIPASLTESRSARLALLLGLLATLAAALLPLFTRRALLLMPFLALAWPWAATRLFLDHHDLVERLPQSWLHRTEIWDYFSYRIFDHPILGWGLATSDTLSPAEPHGSLYRIALVAAPHPHNAVIQLWVELGLPGLGLGLAFAVLALSRTRFLDRRIAPFAIGAWVAAFCLSMIAYNLWSDSLWAAFALTGFAFALLENSKRQNAVKI